ncbi:putative ferredoxin/ferredoxin--NADP reductase [Mycolicibacterium anyangense]|uniref:ferredoxin--NADP(+) reductase n=1 Tax=Mycolicibacterium anyangense TaxID=1431246 RepID=A0A6N4WFS6_9MYCO|nr:FAD-dependent oxidoreductase [Mycolicibacterium anyangense]BBZ78061.1 putative ferredoxin/ferredoxin--NADP reductase [Mycolicibacterium anyangense]
MAYVITQNCCKDASCVPVCPVDCIRPVAGAGELTGTDMLYIDPATCIDCGACQEECPVDAVYYEDDLPQGLEIFRDINARYFEQHPLEPDRSHAPTGHGRVEPGVLRVAVVGAGPAGCYAVEQLLAVDGVEVNLLDRLPTPFGLIRAGVAPDHQHTKSVTKVFDRAFGNARLRCCFNVEVGSDITHDELLAHHHAVLYAVGAEQSRQLGIPGEQVSGHHAASEFVGWYNGHPDHAHRAYDLSGERAVIIGNGNVALDVARILLTSAEVLASTDIAEHALDALVRSDIREVVILGRRGPRHAAFSVGEFNALTHLPGVDVLIEGIDLNPAPEDGIETVLKLEAMRERALRRATPGNKRIIFRFHAPPLKIEGETHAEGVWIAASDPAGEAEFVTASIILRATGYRGSAIPGLPFDEISGTIPNDSGRVVTHDGARVPRTYVTGWVKRGPRGVIGTNRTCATQTVQRLWEDFDANVLAAELPPRGELSVLLADRGVATLDWRDWRTIDVAERDRGKSRSRPRIKFVSVDDMLSAVRR